MLFSREIFFGEEVPPLLMRSGATTPPLLPQLVTSLGSHSVTCHPAEVTFPVIAGTGSVWNWIRQTSMFADDDLCSISQWRRDSAQEQPSVGDVPGRPTRCAQAEIAKKIIAIPRFEHLKLCMFIGVNHGDGETRLP